MLPTLPECRGALARFGKAFLWAYPRHGTEREICQLKLFGTRGGTLVSVACSLTIFPATETLRIELTVSS
jgi:hypothetical protein